MSEANKFTSLYIYVFYLIKIIPICQSPLYGHSSFNNRRIADLVFFYLRIYNGKIPTKGAD